MTTRGDEAAHLAAILEELARNHSHEPGDRLGASDERMFFEQVDRGAREETVDAAALEGLGARYAERFLMPFLRERDPVGVVSEIAALLAVHQRGTLRLLDYNPAGEGADMLLALERLTPAGWRPTPNPFDVAMVRAALEASFDDVDVTAIPSHGHLAERLHVHTGTPRSVTRRGAAPGQQGAAGVPVRRGR